MFFLGSMILTAELIFSKKEHIKGEKSYLSRSSDTFLMLL